MKKRFVSRTLLGAAIAAGTLYTAAAQAAPRTHDGFHLNLHTGFGYLSSTASFGPFEQTLKGVTSSSGILLGGTVTDGLVIGGTLSWHYAPSAGGSGVSGSPVADRDISLYLIGIGPYVDFYPDPTEGLHFQGMVGWGVLDASVDGASGGSAATGVIMQLGVGYDFWVGDQWSIGPLARFAYAPLSLEEATYSTIAPSLVCSFTYH